MTAVDSMGWIIGCMMVFATLMGVSSLPVKYIRRRFPTYFGEGSFGFVMLVTVTIIICLFLTAPCARFLVWLKEGV
ncbi:TPA: hypothetical protein JZE43_004379 [Escherichia coli]|uniref:hypothetical protein n=1 Tax=Salmonella enterica TaxID=28901 RepID=UPI0015FF2FCD|nr:hypothetical protein [Salmonella enterica]HAX4138965.1 hypothetical protein [Escherichia coli]HAX4285794.1 hypothetical protein [Escherichia coli]HAX4359879.1 hypothetical protein [Escherichia coli]